MWWFLPYIDMNQPCTCVHHPECPVPPPSPSHPYGSSQCTSPEHPVSCIKPGLAIYFTYDNIHVSTQWFWGHICVPFPAFLSTALSFLLVPFRKYLYILGLHPLSISSFFSKLHLAFLLSLWCALRNRKVLNFNYNLLIFFFLRS